MLLSLCSRHLPLYLIHFILVSVFQVDLHFSEHGLLFPELTPDQPCPIAVNHPQLIILAIELLFCQCFLVHWRFLGSLGNVNLSHILFVFFVDIFLAQF